MHYDQQKHNLYPVQNTSDNTNAKKKKIKVKFSLFSLISTWFFIGRIPFAPGTLGSLAAYPIYFIVVNSVQDIKQGQLILLIIAIFLTLLGTWSIKRFQNEIKVYDHQCIVIDEVVGMLLTLCLTLGIMVDMAFILEHNYNIGYAPLNLSFFIPFLLFRYSDIHKPFFIRSADQYFKNAFGVMFDDILAALFSAGILYIIYVIFKAFV